jgi:hypothetical protein
MLTVDSSFETLVSTFVFIIEKFAEKSTIFENNVFSEFDAIAVVAVVLCDSIVSGFSLSSILFSFESRVSCICC